MPARAGGVARHALEPCAPANATEADGEKLWAGIGERAKGREKSARPIAPSERSDAREVGDDEGFEPARDEQRSSRRALEPCPPAKTTEAEGEGVWLGGRDSKSEPGLFLSG